jgi:hypothetical protein
MVERYIRVYFSGYIDKEIPGGIDENKIYAIKEELCASLTPEKIGIYMEEDDWRVLPGDYGAILR